MDEYPESDGHFRRYILVTSLLEIEKTARCWSRPCVGDSQKRRQTDIIPLDCSAFRDPAGSALRNHWGVHPTTLSKILSHREFPGLLLDLVERVTRFANRDPQAKILIGFICMKARHRSVACSYLMQAIHTALNCSVNTRTTALASRGRHLCNRDTCPGCSHLSAAPARLMESVRDRLVASWNKAVADAAKTLQPPMPGVTLTPMAAAPVPCATGKSWRITEKATPPQSSKRASFLKGTLEQARLAGLTDDEIASIAAALTPVLEKEERSGDIGRSTKRGPLPEARSSRKTKRGKGVLESPPTSERTPLAPEKVTWVKPEEYAAYRARQVEHHKQLLHTGSTTTPATTTATTAATTETTAATTAATTPAAATTSGAPSASVPPAPPPVTQFLGTGRHPRAADWEETLRLTRTSLTATIVISSPCLLAARYRVSSILVQTSSLLSTKFA